MNDVLVHRVDVLEANQKELQIEIRKLYVELAFTSGKADVTHIVTQAAELRQMVNRLTGKIGEIVGAMSNSNDKSLSEIARDININIGDKEVTTFESEANGTHIGNNIKEQNNDG